MSELEKPELWSVYPNSQYFIVNILKLVCPYSYKEEDKKYISKKELISLIYEYQKETRVQYFHLYKKNDEIQYNEGLENSIEFSRIFLAGFEMNGSQITSSAPENMLTEPFKGKEKKYLQYFLNNKLEKMKKYISNKD